MKDCVSVVGGMKRIGWRYEFKICEEGGGQDDRSFIVSTMKRGHETYVEFCGPAWKPF